MKWAVEQWAGHESQLEHADGTPKVADDLVWRDVDLEDNGADPLLLVAQHADGTTVLFRVTMVATGE